MQLALETATHVDPTQSTPEEAGLAALLKQQCLLVRLGTGLWRISRKMPGDTAPSSRDLRVAQRHIDATCDAMADGGLEVKDHLGDRYVSGMALKVIAFEPTPGTVRATIAETISPSIFYQDQLLQRGEVIVAVPPVDSDRPEDE